jgi:hypothetical protein
MLRLERRPSPSRFWSAATPVLAVQETGLMMGARMRREGGQFSCSKKIAISLEGIWGVCLMGRGIGPALQGGCLPPSVLRTSPPEDICATLKGAAC